LEKYFGQKLIVLIDEYDVPFEQIMDKEYEKELRQDGYKKIVRYGVAFAKKDCLVVKDSCK